MNMTARANYSWAMPAVLPLTACYWAVRAIELPVRPTPHGFARLYNAMSFHGLASHAVSQILWSEVNFPFWYLR
jgi:hypothetical protein